ncbi:hypothetical protein ACWCQZ_46000 [Streptomyces sp. NPDC002285]
MTYRSVAKDALHVAQVALFRHDLRPVVREGQTTILRLLTNRALNSVLHTIAICQIRDGGRGQDYYLRKISEGKTPSEARRALKRRLSNVVYRIMKRDQRNHLAPAA